MPVAASSPWDRHGERSACEVIEIKLCAIGIALVSLGLLGCGGGAPAAIGEACALAKDCESELCERGGCIGPCDAAGVCPAGLACGVDTSGSPQCRPTCSVTASVDGFGCEAGAEVACGFAQSVDCTDCGCESAEFCSSRSDSLGQCLSKLSVNAACTQDAECASGECADGGGASSVCTGPCSAGGTCPGALKCGVGEDGDPECRPACTTTATTNGFGCVGGEEVACDHTNGATVDCSDCGCTGGEFCSNLSDTAGTCLAPRAVGETCNAHAQCADANCSSVGTTAAEGYCQPAINTTCTTSNCEDCQSDSFSSTYCSQSCSAAGQTSGSGGCPAGWACIGYQSGAHWCRELCDTSVTCRLDEYCYEYTSTVSFCNEL